MIKVLLALVTSALVVGCSNNLTTPVSEPDIEFTKSNMFKTISVDQPIGFSYDSNSITVGSIMDTVTDSILRFYFDCTKAPNKFVHQFLEDSTVIVNGKAIDDLAVVVFHDGYGWYIEIILWNDLLRLPTNATIEIKQFTIKFFS